ncbi:type VII secretion protein EccB [Actinoplanes sp. HUAS TT8]|uniref:type VII secretion protein EccB n=1 Tax=Actinoplanes sp. HUAS TT8 TaxID=3447453 RepID=UPI003F51C7FA
MQTRRDQVQAQSHVWSRLVTALIVGDADAAENPNRRTVVGTVSGLLIAVLVVGGFAVYGFIRPGGSTAWQSPGALVVEKETGSRFVYVGGQLRPILNFASVRLILAKDPTVVSVSRRSLAGVPHGQPVGVVGAPDMLPAAGQVAGQVWTVCAATLSDQSGRQTAATTLAITSADHGGGVPLSPDEAILVRSETQIFMIWRGRRLKVTTDWLPQLLGATVTAAPVDDAWLEVVPAGPDLALPVVPGRGRAGRPIDGRPTRIGQLFVAHAATGETRNYLLQRDGLSVLSPLAYAMLAADPATAALYAGGSVRPAEVSPSALAQLPTSSLPALPPGVPSDVPRIVPLPTDGTTWCSRQWMADGTVEIVADSPVSKAGMVTDGLGRTRTARTAAAIAVEPGQGGLVVAGRFDQALGNSRFLVTDSGVRYPVADAAAAERLGYPAGDARPVPPRLLDLLPTGPLLGMSAVQQ